MECGCHLVQRVRWVEAQQWPVHGQNLPKGKQVHLLVPADSLRYRNMYFQWVGKTGASNQEECSSTLIPIIHCIDCTPTKSAYMIDQPVLSSGTGQTPKTSHKAQTSVLQKSQYHSLERQPNLKIGEGNEKWANQMKDKRALTLKPQFFDFIAYNKGFGNRRYPTIPDRVPC